MEGNLQLNGKTVTVNGLPLIFEQLLQSGVIPGHGQADRLLEAVRIYHAIEEPEEAWYREALAAAYANYYRGRTQADVPADGILAAGN